MRYHDGKASQSINLFLTRTSLKRTQGNEKNDETVKTKNSSPTQKPVRAVNDCSFQSAKTTTSDTILTGKRNALALG